MSLATRPIPNVNISVHCLCWLVAQHNSVRLIYSTMSKLPASSKSGSLNRQVVASAKIQSSSPITKRKRSTDDYSETAPPKPAKRKKVKKAKRVEDENLDLEHGLNLAIGKLDSRLQADYVAQRTKHCSSELSLVELEDRHVPGIKQHDTCPGGTLLVLSRH